MSFESKFRNTELETTAVSYIVRKGPAISATANSEWFSIVPYRHILEIVQQQRSTMTPQTLLYQLRAQGKVKTEMDIAVHTASIEELFKIKLSEITPENIRMQLQQLYELSEARGCLTGVRKALTYLKSFQLHRAKNIMRSLGRPVEEIGNSSRAGEFLEDFEHRQQVILERIRKASEEEIIGVPTGISKLDWQLGGVMPGEFGVIGGEAGVGKTASLLAMSKHAYLAGKNVFFASGEMPKDDVQFRVDSSIAGISAGKFRMGSFTKADFKSWKSQIAALRSMQHNFFEFVAFPRNFTAASIEAEMLRVQEKHKQPIDLLVVDYLNIMKTDAGHKADSNKDWQSQADVVWDFKELVSSFNGGIAAWTAGQLTDEYIGADTLSLRAFKYARAISETAPIAIGLLRTEDDILYNTLQLQILKMRNTALPKENIVLHPNLDLMRINQEISSIRRLTDDEDEAAERSRRRVHKKKGGSSGRLS